MPRNERLRRLARGIMPRIPHEVNWYMDPRTERWVVEAKCAGRWRKVAEHPTYEEAHEQWAALIRGRIAATQAIYKEV